jgi:hypothetical protein
MSYQQVCLVERLVIGYGHIISPKLNMLNICSGSISSQLTEVLFAGLREACNPVNKLAVEAINVIFNTYEKLERLFVEQGKLKEYSI